MRVIKSFQILSLLLILLELCVGFIFRGKYSVQRLFHDKVSTNQQQLLHAASEINPSSTSDTSPKITFSKIVGTIDHVLNPNQLSSFDSLKEIGLNISSELESRNVVPCHITSTTDLFCNTELNMEQIEAVGFDMDYTLAQYKESFDLLAYEGTKYKLIHWLGYPQEIGNLTFQSNLCRRGLLIDKKRGNIIKLDQHRYVRHVEHGLLPLNKEERKIIYRESYQDTDLFNNPNLFVNIDTPFSLVDSGLFAQLVHIKDVSDAQHGPASFYYSKSYEQLYYDMRKCLDRCHRDGVIKLQVAKNPGEYIKDDPDLFPMLQRFKAAGRKVFLLTNSLWDFTNVVMNYLEGQKTHQHKDLAWTEYFDLIIVGGNKPAFLLEEKSALPLYRVDPHSGALTPVDVVPHKPCTAPSATHPLPHSPPAQLLQAKAKEQHHEQVNAFFDTQGKIFQGGNAAMLHQVLHIASGDQLLYVGDHIFADILRSKKSLGWRTCLIVPELSHEISVMKEHVTEKEKLLSLRKQQYLLEEHIDFIYTTINRLKKELATCSLDATERILSLRKEIELAEELSQTKQMALLELRNVIRHQLTVYDEHFHPRWGQLFKAGFQESSISKQIKDFACIYTSKASNLGYVSPFRPFRPTRGKMPHDHLLEGL